MTVFKPIVQMFQMIVPTAPSDVTLRRHFCHTVVFKLRNDKYFSAEPEFRVLSQRQILGTGNLPQDSAPVCINIDISPEMAAQSAQRN